MVKDAVVKEKVVTDETEVVEEKVVTDETEAVEENITVVEISDETRSKLEASIRKHIYTSMTIGLVPIPIFDMAALVTVQVSLIRKIAKAYDVPLMQEKIKTTVGSLIAAIAPQSLAPTLASLTKFIPFVGQSMGSVTMPVLAGASTYATAMMFQKHFESGGTLLSFDFEKMREFYNDAFEKGKSITAKLKRKKAGDAEMEETKVDEQTEVKEQTEVEEKAVPAKEPAVSAKKKTVVQKKDS